jgi:assimilatory nitrate reductase catalytic subunit
MVKDITERGVSAAHADLHLPPLHGTDVALFNGLPHLLLWDDHVDGRCIAAHTEGFKALKDIVRECTPAVTAR